MHKILKYMNIEIKYSLISLAAGSFQLYVDSISICVDIVRRISCHLRQKAVAMAVSVRAAVASTKCCHLVGD